MNEEETVTVPRELMEIIHVQLCDWHETCVAHSAHTMAEDVARTLVKVCGALNLPIIRGQPVENAEP
jgi:hypothetical protein